MTRNVYTSSSFVPVTTSSAIEVNNFVVLEDDKNLQPPDNVVPIARTEVLRQHGGFYERDRCEYGEDAYLWLRVLLNESVIVNLTPLTTIHFEASGATQTRRRVRPIEPFLLDPAEIKAKCPAHLRGLLDRVLAIRAFKTACMLGYWGRWREARQLLQRFHRWSAWRSPWFVPSQVAATPVGGTTPVQQVEEGFQLVGVCAKRALEGQTRASEELRTELYLPIA